MSQLGQSAVPLNRSQLLIQQAKGCSNTTMVGGCDFINLVITEKARFERKLKKLTREGIVFWR